MTMWNVRGVTRSDEHMENYHQTLQLPSALKSLIASFSSLFCSLCLVATLLFWFTLTALINIIWNAVTICLRGWWRPKLS